MTDGVCDTLRFSEAGGELAAVVTLGSASASPETAALEILLSAPRWYIATDRDDAEDKSAEALPSRSQRVRPPEPLRDWTNGDAAGVDECRWWRDSLTGITRPSRFNWDALSQWRSEPNGDDGKRGVGRSPPISSPDPREAADAPARPRQRSRPPGPLRRTASGHRRCIGGAETTGTRAEAVFGDDEG